MPYSTKQAKISSNNSINYGSTDQCKINHDNNIISSSIQIHAHLSRRNIKNKKKSPNRSPFFRAYSPALTSRSAAPKTPKFTSSIIINENLNEISSDNGSYESDNDDNSIESDNNLKNEQINVWQAGFTIINLFLFCCPIGMNPILCVELAKKQVFCAVQPL